MKYLLLVIFTILLTGCADSVSLSEAMITEPVGFLHGLWHGLIFPVSWFLSLFMDEVAVYAIYNNGGWYDFGFFLGICGIFSSGNA